MSQRAVFVEVDGNLFPEIQSAMPDYDDCVSIVRDMELDLDEGDTCEVCAVWFEIGEGESDTDEFFPEESLLAWYESGTLEKEVEKQGHYLEEIQSDTTHVRCEDVFEA